MSLPVAVAEQNSNAFSEAFSRFQQLIVAKSGHRFTNFHEGLAAVWESYKPRLRGKALELLAANNWSETSIGTGTILKHTIDAIEVQDSRSNLTNYLVFWQNRFGHANRDHRVLLEAGSSPRLRRDLEQLLFGLYRGNASQEATFGRLSDLTGAKYPLWPLAWQIVARLDSGRSCMPADKTELRPKLRWLLRCHRPCERSGR
jgi:hypothetical protein